MIAPTLRRAAGLACLTAVTLSCNNEGLVVPTLPSYAGAVSFRRYVSMGNSITSGLQSGGINDSTQRQAYPVLVAAAMGGDPFYYPSLAMPGCPPPYANVFTKLRITGDTLSTTCAFRSPAPVPYISNVAVPGAEALDVTQNGPGAGTNSNALTQLFLGGRTQIQAMMAAAPTFVSVWIGNNDVLGAFTSSANAGDSTLITPLATFQTNYQNIVNGVKATGAKAILIGVANVTDLPFASSGATYFAIKNGAIPGAAFPPTFTVLPACAPSSLGGKGDSVLVPFPFGATLVGAAAAGLPDTLRCTEPQTVQPAELRKLVATVLAYNTFISGAASANGWVYLDPNPALDSLRTISTQIAPFPSLGAACGSFPFGLAFTCDGIHPSASTHHLIAQKIVQAINAKYGSAIPAP